MNHLRICSNKFRTHFIPCLHTHSHLHAHKPWPVNWVWHLGTLLDLRWWPILWLTAHKPKQITCRGSAHIASASPHKGIKYIKRSCYFKRWFRFPAVGETTGRSWHSGYSEALLRHHQASQRTTGKSTWMQGISSFIIPWGVRFLWILFSLAFFRPFFVTIVSS